MNSKYEVLANLVERAKQNDEDAFAQLFYTFSKTVYYTGLRITKNESDANDIVQDTMFELYKNIKSIKNPHALIAYINRITNNKCVDYLRKTYNNEVQLVDKDLELLQNQNDTDYVPEEYLLKKELRSQFIDLIDELSDSQRSVIIFYYYKQLSLKQISEMLGIAEEAVAMRLSRARVVLKQKLEEKQKV